VTDPIPPIPLALLAPLLDEAAATLRTLDPGDIPVALRALAGFDPRGLARGPARRQLLRAFESHDDFRAAVIERFARQPETDALVAAWSLEAALPIVKAAPVTALPRVASMLFALRPEGWSFALGAVCEAAGQAAETRSLDDEARRRAAELTTAAEASRRAEAGRAAADRERERIERELRAERQARREKEREAAGALDEALRQAAAVTAELDRERAVRAAAEARAQREVDRASAYERELRAAERAAPPPPDLRGLSQAAGDARALADRLDELAAAATGPVGAPAPSAFAGGATSTTPSLLRATKIRRVRPGCPPGLRADSRAGLDGMLRSRGVVLVVDGYNVSKTAWPTASLEAQRERLLAALAELHLRIRCEVVVAFDGAGLRGVPSPRRPGVRVVFSEPGEPADDVVVREAGVLPGTVPVVVASTDAEVRDRATAEGAVVVTSSVLLSVLRR
jgi:predicted RNA-binding protein with PIN domain